MIKKGLAFMGIPQLW